jgi:hypothetical protein
MTEQDAAPILLVRSIEETDPKIFPASALSKALGAAATDLRPASWFLIRSRYLLNAIPHPYGAIMRMAQLPEGWTIALCVFAFLVGLATNYLGSFSKIPILLNPIMALVAWNLLIYIALFVWWLRARIKKAKRAAEHDDENRFRAAQPENAAPMTAPVRAAPWTARVLFPWLWISIHNFTLRFHATRKQAATFAGVARRFWSHWVDAARPLLAARWRRLSHCAAIALTMGAVAGMYIRGVFLRYDVVWSSTFINDEMTVARWVEFVFAPAIWLSRLAGRDLGVEIDMAQLMSAQGAPAAPWIHLFVLTAAVFIVVPRSVLAAAQGFAVRRAKANVHVDFDDYFARLIRPQIEGLIAQQIERRVRSFAEAMADFVCERFYNQRIVPELAQFRANGGKVSDLRRRIHDRCEDGRDEIDAFAAGAVKDLEASIAPAVDRALSAVRQDFHFSAAVGQDFLSDLEILPADELDRSVKPIGAGFADAIGASVSGSVAIALGTLAGGFGESLEIAVIVALFGTTGPVGFLIGALVGLIGAAGVWWWGREKITEQIENISLPGRLVAMVLWQSRFDGLIRDGSVRCREVVARRVNELLSPLSSRIATDVWTRLEELWHEQGKRTASR